MEVPQFPDFGGNMKGREQSPWPRETRETAEVCRVKGATEEGHDPFWEVAHCNGHAISSLHLRATR